MAEPIRETRPEPSAPVMMLKKCRIEVEGFGLIEAQPGPLFLDVLNRHGLDLHNDCGGYGKCGKCLILFHTTAPECLKGDMRHLDDEKRASGLRLACYHQIREDCRITIPPAPEPDLLDDLRELT